MKYFVKSYSFAVRSIIMLIILAYLIGRFIFVHNTQEYKEIADVDRNPLCLMMTNPPERFNNPKSAYADIYNKYVELLNNTDEVLEDCTTAESAFDKGLFLGKVSMFIMLTYVTQYASYFVLDTAFKFAIYIIATIFILDVIAWLVCLSDERKIRWLL